MQGDVHSVLLAQGQVIKNANRCTLLYGTSDPVANLGEYILTALVANRLGVPATFLVYEHGSREYVDLSRGDSLSVAPECDSWQNEVARWLGATVQIKGLVEVIKPSGLWNMPLGEIVAKMIALRPSERMLILRTAKSAFYSDNTNILCSREALGDWHQGGAWMGGALIHYCLRVYDEKVRGWYVHLAPWNDKGRVYQMYAGSTARFVLAPWLGIIPPSCKNKWGVSFRPECFGTLLERFWDKSYKQAALELVTKSIFEGKQSRKVTLEVSQQGLHKC